MWLYKRILLPTDGSVNAEKAVAHGVELAGAIGAEVVALYVVDTSPFVSLPETFIWENTRDLLVGEGKKALGFVERAAKKREVKVKTVIKEGSPSKEIVDTADEEKADLIIMGTAGRSGLDKFFLGSISEKVLRAAHCPVMVVK
ncbi:MAG: universal stress protein [Candidatus Hydrothermarchaeales archaeon]